MKGFSGKFVLRIGGGLHERISNQACKKGLSLNAFCINLLEYALENRKSPLPKERLEQLVQKTKKHFGDNLIGLLVFGSAVKKETFDNSDIDLLVVLESQTNLSRKLYQDWDKYVDDEKEPIINPHFVHMPQKQNNIGSLWFDIANSHDVLWLKDNRVLRTIKTINELILKEKVQTHQLHGQPYWSWEEYAQ